MNSKLIWFLVIGVGLYLVYEYVLPVDESSMSSLYKKILLRDITAAEIGIHKAKNLTRDEFEKMLLNSSEYATLSQDQINQGFR